MTTTSTFGEIAGLEKIDDKILLGFERLERNMCRVKDIKTPCAAYITPDGLWHEEEIKLKFNNSRRVSRTWRNELTTIFKQYAEHLIVGMDCHT